jgi:hypothetical protein
VIKVWEKVMLPGPLNLLHCAQIASEGKPSSLIEPFKVTELEGQVSTTSGPAETTGG